MTTGSFIMVYAIGCAAALRLLPRGTAAHRCAQCALASVVVLCLATGWFLIWPLVMSGCALLYLRVNRRRVNRADVRCDLS
jgi:amino acid efflux transporter